MLALVGVLALTAGSTFTTSAKANPVQLDSHQAALGEAASDEVRLDDLARTPPMGFNNWNSTACRATFNEAFIKDMATASPTGSTASPPMYTPRA